jgi:hypothetical protein
VDGDLSRFRAPRCPCWSEPAIVHFRDLRKSSHPPTLRSAFPYLDASFMVWVLLSGQKMNQVMTAPINITTMDTSPAIGNVCVPTSHSGPL